MDVLGEEADLERPSRERGDAEEEVEIREERGHAMSRPLGLAVFPWRCALKAGFGRDVLSDVGILPSPSGDC